MALDLDLSQFNDFVDESGRQFGPLIHRTGAGAIQSVDLPTTQQLQGFSSTNPADVAQMDRLLSAMGKDTVRHQMDGLQQHLGGFNILPGDARFDVQMDRLKNGLGGPQLLAQSRRTSEQYETAVAINGNFNQQVMRVAEGPDPCELCLDETGEEGTVRQLSERGLLPGGSSCLGSDFCLCVLVPIE